MVDLPPEFRATPLGFYVWSRCPRASHVLAFAIGQFVDAGFRWMSIRETPETPSEEEPWVRRLVSKERLIDPLAPSELGQGPRVRRQTFNAFIRANGGAAERLALEHFFLLPERLRAVLDELSSTAPPRAVVVSNTNRVREYYPTDPDRLRAYTDVFPRSGISIIATSVPPPYKGRYGFDIVLWLDVASVSEWRAANLVVEKGLRSGEFRTGRSFPTNELRWYLEAGERVERALT